MSGTDVKNAIINQSDIDGYTGDTMVDVTIVQVNSANSMSIAMAAVNHDQGLCNTLVARIGKVTFTPPLREPSVKAS